MKTCWGWSSEERKENISSDCVLIVMIAINIITITPKDVGMAIPMFAHEEKEAQERQITGWIPHLATRRGFKPGCLTPVPHLPAHDLSILPFICFHDRLWGDSHVPGMAGSIGWLAIFLSFTWEGLSPQLKGIWKDLWLFWSCDTGRGSGFLFCKRAVSRWKMLFSFCAYDAAKLSPGFISKWKEAAKIAILML